MKYGIIYATKSGHSKKIAEAIAAELNITAANVTKGAKPEEIDLLFIVGGIYGNQSLPELLNYIKELDRNNVKKAVLITSCASKKAKQNSVRDLLKGKNIEVADEEFICQGSFLVMGMGHPNQTDIDNAVTFAKKQI